MHSKRTRTREVWKKCRKSLTLYKSNNLGLAYKHAIEINSLSVIPSCIYSQMEFLFLQRNTDIDFSKTLKYLMWIRNTNTKYPNNLHLHIFSERWKPPLVNIEIDWGWSNLNPDLIRVIIGWTDFGSTNHLYLGYWPRLFD